MATTDYNRMYLEGRFVAAPEVRYTKTGSAIGSGTICANKYYQLKNGEEQQETLFMDLEMFGKTAELAGRRISKGQKVIIEGHLKQNVWEGQDGKRHSKILLVVERFIHIESPRRNEEEESHHY